MVSWVDCWRFSVCIHFFQKSAIFRCSGGIFASAKIEVFRGFQSLASISTLILRGKMIAPSLRSLSKALISELSIEPLTKVLPILVSKLCQFWYHESATFSGQKSSKCPNLWRSVDDFWKSKRYVPPQKVASKIVEPDALEVIRAIFRRYKVGPNCGAKSHFEITGLYP